MANEFKLSPSLISAINNGLNALTPERIVERQTFSNQIYGDPSEVSPANHPAPYPVGQDTVPAMLTAGEYVVNKEATAMFGPQLEAINQAGLDSRNGPLSTPAVKRFKTKGRNGRQVEIEFQDGPNNFLEQYLGFDEATSTPPPMGTGGEQSGYYLGSNGLPDVPAMNQHYNMGGKISKLYDEGFTAPGQAYAVAKSMGYNTGGEVEYLNVGGWLNNLFSRKEGFDQRGSEQQIPQPLPQQAADSGNLVPPAIPEVKEALANQVIADQNPHSDASVLGGSSDAQVNTLQNLSALSPLIEDMMVNTASSPSSIETQRMNLEQRVADGNPFQAAVRQGKLNEFNAQNPVETADVPPVFGATPTQPLPPVPDATPSQIPPPVANTPTTPPPVPSDATTAPQQIVAPITESSDLTFRDPKRFAELQAHAKRAEAATGVDYRIIMAQAIQESGWDNIAPEHTYFGVKSTGNDGSGVEFNTHEFVNGKKIETKDSFVGYDSLGDSVDGYVDFINSNPRYEKLRKGGTLAEQLDALQKAGYATDPNYDKHLAGIINGKTFQNLHTESASTGIQDVERKPGGHAGVSWQKKYGSTHNQDGTVKGSESPTPTPEPLDVVTIVAGENGVQADGTVPAQPASGHSKASWASRYGKTHNPDGTPKSHVTVTADNTVSARPAGGHSRSSWDSKYGADYNDDGTPKVGEATTTIVTGTSKTDTHIANNEAAGAPVVTHDETFNDETVTDAGNVKDIDGKPVKTAAELAAEAANAGVSHDEQFSVKKAFSDAMTDLGFPPKAIASSLAQAVTLYLMSRLAGFDGNTSLTWAGNKVLRSGSERAQVAQSFLNSDKIAAFTPESLKAYRESYRTSDLRLKPTSGYGIKPTWNNPQPTQDLWSGGIRYGVFKEKDSKGNDVLVVNVNETPVPYKTFTAQQQQANIPTSTWKDSVHSDGAILDGFKGLLTEIKTAKHRGDDKNVDEAPWSESSVARQVANWYDDTLVKFSSDHGLTPSKLTAEANKAIEKWTDDAGEAAKFGKEFNVPIEKYLEDRFFTLQTGFGNSFNLKNVANTSSKGVRETLDLINGNVNYTDKDGKTVLLSAQDIDKDKRARYKSERAKQLKIINTAWSSVSNKPEIIAPFVKRAEGSEENRDPFYWFVKALYGKGGVDAEGNPIITEDPYHKEAFDIYRSVIGTKKK